VSPAEAVMIHWRDMAGKVHRCKSGEASPGALLVWTLCHFDVPPGEAYTVEPEYPGEPLEPVTCPLCLTGESVNQPCGERIGRANMGD
jgi:hypothetical protein